MTREPAGASCYGVALHGMTAAQLDRQITLIAPLASHPAHRRDLFALYIERDRRSPGYRLGLLHGQDAKS